MLQEQNLLAFHKHQQLAAVAAAAVVAAAVLVAVVPLYQLDRTTVHSMQPRQQHLSPWLVSLSTRSTTDEIHATQYN